MSPPQMDHAAAAVTRPAKPRNMFYTIVSVGSFHPMVFFCEAYPRVHRLIDGSWHGGDLDDGDWKASSAG